MVSLSRILVCLAYYLLMFSKKDCRLYFFIFLLNSVKRKGDSVVDTIQAGEGLDSLEVDENVEKQSLLEGLKLLANEEFEKEHNENDDSVQEYMVTRKRKASKKLQGSRYILFHL